MYVFILANLRLTICGFNLGCFRISKAAIIRPSGVGKMCGLVKVGSMEGLDRFLAPIPPAPTTAKAGDDAAVVNECRPQPFVISVVLATSRHQGATEGSAAVVPTVQVAAGRLDDNDHNLVPVPVRDTNGRTPIRTDDDGCCPPVHG